MIKTCKQCGKEIHKRVNKFCSFECYCKFPKDTQVIERQRNALKLKYSSGEFTNPNKGKKFPNRSGKNHFMYGKHLPLETIEKIHKSKIGKTAWNKGKKLGFTPKGAFKEGNRPWNKNKKGIHLSQKSEFKKGDMRITGENNNNFNNWSSFEPYTKEFNLIFKESIRQRDNLTCIKCNLSQDNLIKLQRRKLHVHHIDYIKENTYPENCCALCTGCNSEVNFNRPHWTKFFQSLLSERYGYKYYEDGKVIINLNGGNNGKNI